MKPLTSRLTAKGQTTIPVEVRKSLHLDEGDLLFYEVGPDNVVRFRKPEKIDVEWSKAIQSTLTEWQGTEDDDL
jgi:antitoxin PrlF